MQLITKFNSEINVFLACIDNVHTKAAYEQNVIQFGQYVAKTWDVRSLNSITLEVFLEYRKHLVKSYSSSTVNAKLTAIKKFMSHLRVRGLIQNAEFALVKGVAVDTEHQTTPTHSGETMFNVFSILQTKTASEIQLYLTLFLGVNTGARREELVMIQLQDIVKEGENHYVFIRSGKGFKARNIAISASIFYRLQELIKQFSSLTKDLLPTDYILTGTSNRAKRGTPITTRAVNSRLDSITELTDIEELTPHSMRRTYANELDIQMEKAGHSLEVRNAVLKMRLGHAKFEVTEKYLTKDRQKRMLAGTTTELGVMEAVC